MITAVDSNVLLDVFAADVRFGERSREALRSCAAAGGLIACEVVWAEIAGAFASPTTADERLRGIGVSFDALSSSAAVAAGQAWRTYRERGGRRDRILGDFLIAAHALTRADRLLTRDKGFYRMYFEDLEVVDPTAD